MLVAGWEYCGESREVIRKRRSRLFFLCKHECSPSTSAIARRRFPEEEGGDPDRNERGASGRGRALKANSVFERLSSVGKVKFGLDDGDDGDEEGDITPRRAASLVDWGQ
jgi:hypothetical protein